MRRLLLIGTALFCLCAVCSAQIVQPRGVLSGIGYKNYLYTGTTEDFFRGYMDGALKFAVDKDGNITTVGTVDGVDVSTIGAASHARGHSVVSAADHTDWPAGVSLAELGYLDGVTSSLQSQLDAKLPTATYTSHASNTGAHHAPVTAGEGITVTGQQVTNTDTGSAAVSSHQSTYDHTLIHERDFRSLRVKWNQFKDIHGNSREIMHFSNGVAGFHVDTGLMSSYAAMSQGITIRGNHVLAMACEPVTPTSNGTGVQTCGPWYPVGGADNRDLGIWQWAPIVYLTFLDENGNKIDPAALTPDNTKVTVRFIRWVGRGAPDANFKPQFDLYRDKTLAVKVMTDTHLVDDTATSGNATELRLADEGWTVNAYTGCLVWIYEGAGKGQIRRINSNSTERIYPMPPFSVGPDNTSKFQIIPADALLWESHPGDQGSITGSSDVDMRKGGGGSGWRTLAASIYEHSREEANRSYQQNLRVWFYVSSLIIEGGAPDLYVHTLPAFQMGGVTSWGNTRPLWHRQIRSWQGPLTKQGNDNAWANDAWNYIKLDRRQFLRGTNMIVFGGGMSPTSKFSMGVHDLGVKSNVTRRNYLLYTGVDALEQSASWCSVVEQDVTLYRDQDKFDWVVRVPYYKQSLALLNAVHGGVEFSWNMHLVQTPSYTGFTLQDQDDAMMCGELGYNYFIPDTVTTPTGAVVQPGSVAKPWYRGGVWWKQSLGDTIVGDWKMEQAATGRYFTFAVDNDGVEVEGVKRNIDWLGAGCVNEEPFFPRYGGVATGGSANTVVDSGADWETNILAGKFVWIAQTTDHGAPENQVREITANTATTITVTPNWTDANPGSGDEYYVVDTAEPHSFNDIVLGRAGIVRMGKYYFDEQGDQASTMHVDVSGLVNAL